MSNPLFQAISKLLVIIMSLSEFSGEETHLSTITEQWMDSEGLQNQGLGKYIDQLEGDFDFPDDPDVGDNTGADDGKLPNIKVGGGGAGADGDGDKLPSINIDGGSSNGADADDGKLNPHCDTFAMEQKSNSNVAVPANIAAGLVKLKGAIANVDITFKKEPQLATWWTGVRGKLMQGKLKQARAKVETFLGNQQAEQGKLVESLQGLVNTLGK